MVKIKSEYKVPQGKMLRLFMTIDGETISDLKITGDFFMHPEEAIWDLESFLKGTKIDEGNLPALIDDFLQRRGIKVLGLSAKDLSAAILRAIQGLS